MVDPAEPPTRDRDLERFLTFLDAVVAIAITLLVLPLVDLAGELDGSGSVTRLLGDHRAELLAFALSFVVIARLWFIQHGIMRHVVSADRVATRFLVVWMFLIVLLPFPTALVAQAGQDPATKVFYVGTIALSTLCLAGTCAAIARDPAVRAGGRAPRVAPALVTALFLCLALVIMLAVPGSSYWPLLLLVVDDRALGLADRWRGR